MRCACGKPIVKRRGAGKKRTRCERCRKLARRQKAWARLQRHRQKRQRNVGGPKTGGLHAIRSNQVAMTRDDIARVVGGKDRRAIAEVERRALAKMREHPLYQEVKEAFLDWVRAGKPRPPKREPGDVLLEHQAQVAGLYEQYERLLPVAPEAANEMLDEIEKYQNKLGQVRDELLQLKYE